MTPQTPLIPDGYKNSMEAEIRNQLHQLLNKMIDDGEEVGVLQKASMKDGFVETETYRLLLTRKVAQIL